MVTLATEAQAQTQPEPVVQSEHSEQAAAQAQRALAADMAETAQREQAEALPERVPDANPDTPSGQAQAVPASQSVQVGDPAQPILSADSTDTTELDHPRPLRPGQARAIIRADRTDPASPQSESTSTPERCPRPTTERSTSSLLEDEDTPLLQRSNSPVEVPVGRSPHLARNLGVEQAAGSEEEGLRTMATEEAPQTPSTAANLQTPSTADQRTASTEVGPSRTVAADEMRAAEERAALQAGERKRRKSESQVKKEMSDAKFKQRYDSIWGRGNDRRGSGAGGAVGN